MEDSSRHNRLYQEAGILTNQSEIHRISKTLFMWWQAGSFVFTKWTQLTNSIQEDSKSLGIPKALFFFCFFFICLKFWSPLVLIWTPNIWRPAWEVKKYTLSSWKQYISNIFSITVTLVDIICVSLSHTGVGCGNEWSPSRADTL